MAFAWVLLGAAIATDFVLSVSPDTLVGNVLEWLPLGIGRELPLNGYDHTWMLVAGVTWSLRWEWGFYLTLPILGLVFGTRWRSRWGALLTIPIIVVITHRTGWAGPNMLIAFAIGIFAATLGRPKLTQTTNALLSVVALVAVARSLTNPSFHTPDGWIRVVPLLLLGISFVCVSSGASIFGLLTSRPAKRLGDVSYPLYLLQGLALNSLRTIPTLRHAMVASITGYWLLVLVAANVLIVIATAVHVLVERPGIALGQRVMARGAPSVGGHEARAGSRL